MGYASFGSYSLDSFSSGLGNILRAKDVSAPEVAAITSPIARGYGVVKNGEQILYRDIDVIIKIVGSSRSDLVSRLDALKKALRLRGQQLVIYEDLRYFANTDCISAPATLSGAANISAALVTMKFRSYDPMAYAASSSSYDTGVAVLTLSGGTWNFVAISLAGGGTIETYPLIHIINKTSTGSTTTTTARNSGTAYTTLPVSATSFSASVGDRLILSNGTNTQTVAVATAFSSGATTITVNSFTANATYASGATVTKDTQWSAITVSQTQDSQTLTTYSTSGTPLPSANNDYVDIQCDPIVGMSIITNGSGEVSDPVGVFPTLNPDSTTFNIAITSNSAVSAEAVFSWSSRYL
jgi:hypothetical protein